MADKLSERLYEIVAKPYDLRDLPRRTEVIREAAELARRVEAAPVVDVYSRELQDRLVKLDGQRVRIVPEAGQGSE